jgi:hypothetical protein
MRLKSQKETNRKWYTKKLNWHQNDVKDLKIWKTQKVSWNMVRLLWDWFGYFCHLCSFIEPSPAPPTSVDFYKQW